MNQDQLEGRMKCFSWLHLTDLHRGMEKQSWLWPGTREIFFKDLKKLHEKCGPWDLVLFTGDLTQQGSVEEFQKVDELFEQLWEQFESLDSSPKLLTVPGNHDLVRPERKKPEVKVLRYWDTDQDVREEFWEDADSPYRKVVTWAFEPYVTWWEQCPFTVKDVNPGILPGDFSVTFEKLGAKLGIVGLNTSFLQLTDTDYEGKLALHAKQFHGACDGDGPAWVKQHHVCLLLTHHPPAWLNSDSRQHLEGEITAYGRFAVHLCGHAHKTESWEIVEGGTKPRRIWQGRSLFGLKYFGTEHKGQRLHGYSAGRIELRGNKGKLMYWPRKDETQGRQRSIVPDYSVNLTDDQHTYPIDFELLQHLSQELSKRSIGNKQSTVMVIVEGNPNDFDEKTREELKISLADLLNIDIQHVRILVTMPGSIRVIIELPTNSAEELVDLFTTRSEKLDQLLSQFVLKNIKLDKGIENYTKKLIDDFERSDLSTGYIELEGSKDLKGNKLETTIDKYVKEWIMDENCRRLAILGDYGSGKTSFCLKLAYDLALKYKKDPTNNLIPVFITLKDNTSLNRTIEVFEELQKIEDVELNGFQEMLKSGRFVFILDSFDALPEQADIWKISANLAKIEKLIPPKNKDKLILTCRTHIFETQEDIKKAFGRFEILYIDPFSEEQIERFLQKYSESQWEDFLRFINAIRNLKDLATRPILLALMVQIIPRLKEKKTQEITAATLYQYFIDRWITHSERPRFEELKRRFMKKLAMDMLLEGGIKSIHYLELYRIIESYLPKERYVSEEDLKDIEKEIRTCSFLVCDEEGNYRFAHRSFFEFFLAQMLVEELKKEKPPHLFTKYIYLPVEVYAFVKDLIPDFTKYYDLLVEWMKQGNYPAASFIGQMGFQELIPELLNVLSEENYNQETKYNAARALERLHNSSSRPYFEFILNWREHNKLPNCFRLNTVAIRGNKRKTPKPGFSPATYILKEYEDHPEEEWVKTSDILIKSLDNASRFVRINVAHALTRWLHPDHLSRLIDKIKNERDRDVKGNLIYCLIKRQKEGKLDDQYGRDEYDFSRATLRDLELNGQQLSRMNFQSSNLKGAQFNESLLTEANFEKADLSGASFQGADLRGANFQKAKLHKTNFENAKVAGVNLTGATFGENPEKMVDISPEGDRSKMISVKEWLSTL